MRKLLGSVVVAAIAVLVVWTLAAASTSATQGEEAVTPPQGRYVFGLFSHDYDREFFKLVPASEWQYMRHPKIELRWEKLEPKKGVYDWSSVDRQLEALKKNGFDDLLLLINVPTPAWARDAAYGDQARRGPPENIEDWQNFIDQVTARYAGVADFYEILNEPGWDINSAAMEKYGSFHFGGEVETDYMEMLKAAYGRIKQADPGSMVISGAMNCDVSGVPENGLWLMDLMTDDQHRMQDYCDAFNLHPYYQPDQWGYAYELLRDLLDAKGIEKELLVTEIGWMHHSDKDVIENGMESQRSAIGIRGIGSLVSAGCRKIWVYQDLDDPPGQDYEGLYYGLFDYQGKPTPAWYEFRCWFHIFELVEYLQPSLVFE